MANLRKTMSYGLVSAVVCLTLGFGGVSLSPAVAGTLEPPANGVNPFGDPVPTYTPSLDRLLPGWFSGGGVPRFEVLKDAVLIGGAVQLVEWGVLDRETGLVWEKAPDITAGPFNNGRQDWNAARRHCADREVAEKKGWRLPSFTELASLVRTAASAPPLVHGANLFDNIQLSGYWSATTVAGTPANAWGVGFVIGDVGNDLKGNPNSVWCVRGGGPLSDY
ncbi:MAG: DUF1566 domain-containing protein [Nitrospirota bacterium]|nr:DUF1566 domain-containing protein [Nitrospirota bacterium]